MRAVVDREIVLRVRVDDEGGTLVNADSTPAAPDVRDGDGNAVAGLSAVSTDGTGVYKVTIPARAKQDLLSATWTIVVGGYTRTVRQTVMVTSGRLVPAWRLREDTEITSLSLLNMQRLMDGVEDWFKSALRFPAVDEPLRLTFNYPGGKRLRVPKAPYPKSVLALTINSRAFTTAELDEVDVVEGALEVGELSNLSFITGLPAGNEFAAGRVTAWLTHGGPWTEVPEDIERAAAVLARYVARGSNYPERATQVATEGAIITFAMPDPDHPTGLPDVDAAISRYRFHSVV